MPCSCSGYTLPIDEIGAAVSEQTENEVDFAFFVLYRVANHWGVSVRRAYEMLASVGIVDGYLIPHYDVLHTLGSDYLVEDVVDLARERGLAV